MLKFAKCTCCESEHPTIEMVKTAMPNRGSRAAYMCRECATHNRFYHTSNNESQGVAKANGVGCGIELETAYTNDYARNIMFEYGMIPTNDCSLDGRRTCEYVTGIMQGLNIASKLAVTIETLQNAGHLEINESCGTHFHVSVNAMKDGNGEQVYMQYIRRFYHSLFVPLAESMQAHPDEMQALFGRSFGHYCERITAWSVPDSRYNFINVTNDSNIEFRLNRYQNAKQFQALMKMEVEMVQAIITNFCEHFNDTEIDKRRYSNMTEYRKHKASVTAGKLVKIFLKYASKI